MIGQFGTGFQKIQFPFSNPRVTSTSSGPQLERSSSWKDDTGLLICLLTVWWEKWVWVGGPRPNKSHPWLCILEADILGELCTLSARRWKSNISWFCCFMIKVKIVLSWRIFREYNPPFRCSSKDECFISYSTLSGCRLCCAGLMHSQTWVKPRSACVWNTIASSEKSVKN